MVTPSGDDLGTISSAAIISLTAAASNPSKLLVSPCPAVPSAPIPNLINHPLPTSARYDLEGLVSEGAAKFAPVILDRSRRIARGQLL